MLSRNLHAPLLRELALRILSRVETEGAFADQLLSAAARSRGLPPQERALLRELTYGVLRWRNRLDWIVAHFARRPLESIDPDIRNLLRLGAYQLCYMQSTSPSTAVWESVQLAKRLGHEGIVAFVNAVLRALARQRGSLSFPDPSGDLTTYFTVTLSHPRWLVERWLARYGLQQTEVMCQANNAQPPLTARVNRLRTPREPLLESLREAGCEVEPCRFAPDGVWIQTHPPLDQLPPFLEGKLYFQDEAAMLCSYLVAPRAGDRVLDACAAPGGKATHLAELMDDCGEVVALDRSQTRLRLLEANCRRLGLRSIRCLTGDAATVQLDGTFDRILVDAPCSGLGVIRRHPDAKWRKGPDLIPAMQALQATIVEHLASFLKPGGILVYTTCSTEPEENEEVIRTFLGRHPEYHLDSVAGALPAPARCFLHEGGWFQTWPGPEGLDGFFGARLRRVD